MEKIDKSGEKAGVEIMKVKQQPSLQSECCWQIAVKSPQHLRPCHTNSFDKTTSCLLKIYQRLGCYFHALDSCFLQLL